MIQPWNRASEIVLKRDELEHKEILDYQPQPLDTWPDSEILAAGDYCTFDQGKPLQQKPLYVNDVGKREILTLKLPVQPGQPTHPPPRVPYQGSMTGVVSIARYEEYQRPHGLILAPSEVRTCPLHDTHVQY